MSLYLYRNISNGFIINSVNSFYPTLVILIIIAVAIANIYIGFHLDKLIKHRSKLLMCVPVAYLILVVYCAYTSLSILSISLTVLHLFVMYILFNSLFINKKIKNHKK